MHVEKRQKQRKEEKDHSKIKVLVVTWNFLPEIGGGVDRVVDMMRHISSERFQISILTRKIPYKTGFSHQVQKTRLTRVRSYRVPGFFEYAWFNLPAILSFFLGSLVVILKEDPDVIFFTVPEGENVLGAWIAAKLMRKSCIIDVRDLWEEARLRFPTNKFVDPRIKKLKHFLTSYLYCLRKIFDFVYQKSNLVTGVTPTITQSLIKRGVKRDKVHVVYNGAETSFFKPILNKKLIRKNYELPKDSFIVASEGIMTEKDRIDLVLKALKCLVKVSPKSVIYLVIGDFARSAQKERIKEMIDTLGLSKIVVITGVMPRERAAEVLAASDITVLPLDDDPLWKYRIPLAFYDSLACSIPVVAFCYDDSDLAETIRTHKCGLVAVPNDVFDLTEKLKLLMNEQSLVKEMGQNGYGVAQNLFSRKKMAERLERIFTSICH